MNLRSHVRIQELRTCFWKLQHCKSFGVSDDILAHTPVTRAGIFLGKIGGFQDWRGWGGRGARERGYSEGLLQSGRG
jgi:hypothetical protein